MTSNERRDALNARIAHPDKRALAAGLAEYAGKPVIVFNALGDLPRLEIAFDEAAIPPKLGGKGQRNASPEDKP